MSKKRKFPWWAIVLVVIALCVCGKIWYDSSISGEFDVSAHFPTNEELIYIAEHAQDLIEKDERFTRSSEDEGNNSFYFSDGDVFAQFTILEGAIDELRNPEAVPMVPVSGIYNRQNASDFVDFPLPWSPVSVNIGVIYEKFAMIVMSVDLDAPTDAPLVEMLGTIESIIGKP